MIQRRDLSPYEALRQEGEASLPTHGDSLVEPRQIAAKGAEISLVPLVPLNVPLAAGCRIGKLPPPL